MGSENDDLFQEPGATGLEHVSVRELRPGDIDRVVKIDAKITGRSRSEYLQKKIDEGTRESGVRISLAAETDEMLVGFLLGRLYYGEFGVPEPIATIDTVGVDPEFGGRRIGTALFEQLEMNLRALGIERIQTQVDWQYQDLVGFLASRGFTPAPAICLEKGLGE